MGHSTKPKLEALRAYCKQHSIIHGSNASKLALCQAILAKAQQQPPQQKRRGRLPKQQAAPEQEQLTPLQGVKKKQLRT